MRSVVLLLAVTLPALFACAGGAGGGTTVVRIDYSHVDGGSCMSSGGKPSLAWKETWDLSSCPPRSSDADGLSDACVAAINAECCTQVGGTIVGWEAHSNGGEKLISPLCRL
ncbi:MAG: hypothetical protein R3F61_23465 [Myxococcota bacterium]